MRLEGKVAIVTGSASNPSMGLEAAILFAQEGAKVVCADIDAEGGQKTVAEIIKRGGQGCFTKTDVSQEAEVKAMVDFTVKQYGELNILFNCAGRAMRSIKREQERDGMVTELKEAIWDKLMGINLKGPFFGCKHAIPEMLKQNGGVIINVGSNSAVLAWPESTAYNVSKAGVVMLTKSVALDYGKHGIRCNCVLPGPTRTNMTKPAIEAGREKVISARVFRGYIGEPIEIARVALFLASDEPSFINGAAIAVDGGYTAS